MGTAPVSGGSQGRPGPGGRAKSGKPRPGTGGYGRRRLEGKGPTPPAHLRPGHPAQRRAAAGGAGQAGTASRSAGAAGEAGAARRSAGEAGRPGGAARGTGTAGRADGAPRGVSSGAARRTGSSAARTGGAARTGSTARAGGGARATGSSGRPTGSGGARGTDSGAGRRTGSSGRSSGGSAAEVVTGRNAVLEALRAQVPATALHVWPRLDPDERIGEAVALAAEVGIPVVEAGRAELDRLTGGASHQGLALKVRPYRYAHPDDLVAQAGEAGQPALIVALDGVTDPRNLGAVARSATAFGGHGVLIPVRRSAGVTAGAWKSSAGTLARIPVAQASNLAAALASYQEAGLFTVGLSADGDTEIGELELADGPVVLVVGSEGRGLSRLIAQRCDVLARIPMPGAAESLNAGVAAGIALYEVARRRAAAV
jgi:23S rRNA (guanosine2251-2'-O)-methyltransferase